MSALASSPVAPSGAHVLEGQLMTYEDLAIRWQAPGSTPAERRRWVKRKCRILRLHPMTGFGRGTFARFRPRSVFDAEARSSP